MDTLSNMRTGYKCRAYPTPAQAAVFGRTFGCVRLVWNKTLADRNAAYQQRGKRSSYRQTDAALTAWKKTADLTFLVARAHRKVRNARRDFLHRTSTNLVRRADVIVVEDLTVANMIRDRRLDRPGLDVPGLPHPTRSGPQRGQEHPCGWPSRSRGQPRRCPRS